MNRDRALGTDLQLAATHTADQVLTRTGVTTYRRVTRAGACPLCVAASDRVYTVGDLLPIHTNCHCIVVPGPVLPSSLQRASNTDDPPPDGRGLQIGDNGEIGPVLEYDQTAGTSGGGGRGKRKRSRPAATISHADRRAMKQAQLDGYEKVMADGGGTPWMRVKADELRTELGSGGASGGRPPGGGASGPGADGPIGPRQRPSAADLQAEGVIGEGHEHYGPQESRVATWHDQIYGSRLVSVLPRDKRFPLVEKLKTPDSVDKATGDDPLFWLTHEIKTAKDCDAAVEQVRRGWKQSTRLVIEVAIGTATEARGLVAWALRRYPGIERILIVHTRSDGSIEVLAEG